MYDEYGQLIRENNGHLGRTILYTYDALGNITKAQKYAYTVGEVSGTPTEDTYTYSTTAPDTLATFNSKPITYNSCGCVSDYDGWVYGWKNGKLGSIQKGGIGDLGRALISGMTKQYTFKYDGKGRRIQKKYTYFPGLNHPKDYMSSCTSDYTYDFQGRLLSETRTLKYSDGVTITKTFAFLYEESEIVGVIFTNPNGTGTYYYDKNPRGDVRAIVDNTGTPVVQYAYDAFGNCTCYYSTNDDLANSNPIRYRSYYFDADTGLYYLHARYYNPAWRRFISPDDTAYLDIETVNGLNLYAYCGNDPVNYYDPSGHAALTIGALMLIGFISGAAIGAASSVVGQYVANGFSWDNFSLGQFALDSFLGGVSGLLSMSTLGVGAMVAANAGIGFVGAVGGHLINGSDFSKLSTWLDIGLSTGLGALVGRIGGAGALNASYLNNAKRTAGFIRAAGLYDAVLTKATNGFYRTSGIAANALRLSHNNLVKQWNKMIISQSSYALAKALEYGGIALLIGTAGKGMLYDLYNDFF